MKQRLEIPQRLEGPVEYGDVRLAPSVELAGLAELASLDDADDRLDALLRIAEAIQAEDDARDHLAALRSGQIEQPQLPKRR